MGPTSPPQAQPQFFQIKGWHEDASAQVAVTSSTDIETARRIIAWQSTLLAERCAELDESLRQAGIVDQALEKSKVRPRFDLDVGNAEQPSHQDWRDRRPLVHRTTWEAAPANQTINDWLSANATKGSTFIASGQKTFAAPHDQLKRRGFKVQNVHPGAGSPSISESGNPDRSRPQTGSLAHWFAENAHGSRAKVAGYLLGRNTSAIDCELLRRRLHPGQCVCAELSSEAATHLATDWDGRIIEWPNHVLFIEPGLLYLDPVLIPPDRLGEIHWPRISVVTVSYNQAAFLEDCLRSVLEQNYPNLEYIVVDAVSTDGSQDILRRYEPRLSRLIIEPDKGQSDGLNKGLNLATGDILTWINSDDMLAPGALRRAALAFLDNDCDLVAGGCERITEISSVVTLRHHPALPYARTVPLGFAEQFMWTNSWEKGDYFFQPEVLFTADIWRRSGGYLKLHLHWAMDWELWIRMALAGATIAHIPETIGRSRAHDAQKTTSEERYLYQLRNILLEHDDALSKLETLATTLPTGIRPGWMQLNASRPTVSVFKRISMLRQPGRFRGAVKRRLPPRVVHQLSRLYNLRQPGRLRNAVKRRLPPRIVHQLSRLSNLRQPGRLRSAVKRRLPPRVVHQLSRLSNLRQPGRLRSAVQHRLSPRGFYLLWRLGDLNNPASWRSAIVRRLPPRLKDQLRQARSSLKYGLGGYSVISRVRLKELTRGREILAAAERDARAAMAIRGELESQIAQLRVRCTELSEQCIELSDWRTMATSLVAEISWDVPQSSTPDSKLGSESQRIKVEQSLNEFSDVSAQIEAYRKQLMALLDRYSAARVNERVERLQDEIQQQHDRAEAERKRAEAERVEAESSQGRARAQSIRAALDSVSNYATQLLFDRDADPRTRHTMWSLLMNGIPVRDALRTIAIQCYEEQSKPTYPQRRDLLARTVEMPKLAGSDELVSGYTIIDIGAEPLSFESHIYAALPLRRPSLVIGFDPTDKEAPKTIQTGGHDGAPLTEVRTLPQFIGDGGAATFNLARMQPTSSLHTPNFEIARRFSLLAEALEIVESSAVETYRLDDILAEQDVASDPIDFLKIDVQGATLPVLSAAKQTMARTLVCHLEAEFVELYKGEALFSDVDRHMRSMGFALMDFTTLGRQRYNAFDATNDRFFHAGRLLWADCVYVRHLDEPEKLSDAELMKLAEIAHVVYHKYDVAAFALQSLSQRTNSSFYDDYLRIWG